MHNGKPLIAAARPFWRHPCLPWGWYSLADDNVETTAKFVLTEGYAWPGDGGGGMWMWDASERET